MLPRILYHYTGIVALKSMVKRQELWLTHYKHLNDSKEIITGLEILDEEAMEYLSRCGDITGNIKLPQETFDQYIFCLCARDDNNHLWQNYSGLGGVVLGFDAHRLVSQSTPIVPVSYDLEECKSLFREKISKLKPVSKEDEGLLKDFIRQNNDEKAVREMLRKIPNYIEYRDTMSELSAYATLMKNPHWVKEEEWRMIHWPFVCRDRNLQILKTEIKRGRPRAILQMEKLPLISISSYESVKVLKRKGVLQFLEKYNFGLNIDYI